MKFLSLLALASLATAGPIHPRQLGNAVRTTSNEFTDGGCRDIIMIFARGSTEIGNMGTLVGPPTGRGLKTAFGADRVAVEGVPYGALIGTNALPGGTDARSERLMRDLIVQAVDQCPDAQIVVGGYSQGAAVTHRAVEDLSAAQMERIAAAFTYGDTQNRQDRGQIPNFPAAKTNVICNRGDAVCNGILTILPAHLTYGTRVDEQVAFIVQSLEAAGVSRG